MGSGTRDVSIYFHLKATPRQIFVSYKSAVLCLGAVYTVNLETEGSRCFRENRNFKFYLCLNNHFELN